jgi:pimeloyl-ACP methyl ester carboxylesterase
MGHTRRAPGVRLQGARLKTVFCRFLTVVFLAGWVGGCGYSDVFHSLFDHSSEAPAAEAAKLPGHVYLFRGLVGDIYSLGMDQLADKLMHHGVTATVHGVTEYGSVADDIIRKYKAGDERGPIILVGHSTGGDLIIAMAERLKQADIPVALAFGFDPTRIADDVPSNVELFINLFQRTNPIGGGEATAGRGFRGRLINVDLREHSEIVHINLDKTVAVQDLVVAKIVALCALAHSRAAAKRADLGNDVRPLVLKYTVPGVAPIELWDSAINVKARPGDTIDLIAARNAVPIWVIAQINAIDQDHPIEAGRTLLIPRNMYSEAALQAAVSAPAPSNSARPAAAVSSSRAPVRRSAPGDAAPIEETSERSSTHSFSDRWGGAFTQ